ncbi:MAG: hypothetical protein CMM58_12285 [Rhodospirillaceae bacterium]|nr:hypothetical protein [Rhodospirillaceae bacterium]|tara:strand:+ start:2589 stop:3275 length:687 start_codon:yes stop_codon:yes gene_type:complete
MFNKLNFSTFLLKKEITRPPLGFLFFAIVVLCLLFGYFIDQKAANFIKQYQTHLFVDFFRLITIIGDATGWLLIFSLGLLICFFLRRSTFSSRLQAGAKRYRQIFWYLILSCVLSGALHHIIKIIIGRYRPRYLFSDELYGLAPFNFNIAANSFPSGHTQTIFSICIGLSIVYPRYAVILWSLAVLVGFSRVVLLAHYPSDVVFGAYLGITVAVIVGRNYFRQRITNN